MVGRWLLVVATLSVTACSDIPPNHDTEQQCGCVSESVRLRAVESVVPTRTIISSCRTFTLELDEFSGRPAASCQTSILCPPQMGGGNNDAAPQVTGIDVARALADPDVLEARGAAPIRYGAGPGTPGGGGPLYSIGLGSAEFEVGGPCGSSPCTPVPAGVQHLLDVLLAVNAQEIIRSPCREMLGR